ncbi:LOW QUALITY PROTEIN: hypothetical protein M8C21_032628, partial [Ambrosia artemisiifolia]
QLDECLSLCTLTQLHNSSQDRQRDESDGERNRWSSQARRRYGGSTEYQLNREKQGKRPTTRHDQARRSYVGSTQYQLHRQKQGKRLLDASLSADTYAPSMAAELQVW